MKKYTNFHVPCSSVIIINLQLLGITNEACYQQTKLPLVQSSISKLVYFVIFHSLKILSDDCSDLNNWYPARTASDQAQFKKTAMEVINRLQLNGKLPKNFIIDKRAFDDSTRVLQLLRYLSEFALRHQYIRKYGDLIQIALSPQNQDINKYYPQLMNDKLINQEMLQLFEGHIDMLKSQIIHKSTFDSFQTSFGFQELMGCIEYQNNIKQKLSKVPKEVFLQNRQLDRIQIIDKLNEIWKTLDLDVQKVDVGANQFIEGEKQFIQIDAEWQSWFRKLNSGLRNLNKKKQQQQIRRPKKIHQMEKILQDLKNQVKQLKQFKQDVMSIMMD